MLEDATIAGLPADPCDESFEHTTAGRKRAVADVTNNIRMHNRWIVAGGD
jgi:hypothetical protein